MSWASNEAVGLLMFLLPGFVAAAIFYSLTSFPRPGAFDRVVVALIFTAIGQTITEYGLPAITGTSGETLETGGWKPLVPLFVAVALGLGASVLSNTDFLHRLLRRVRFTRETSYPSEWYSTFARMGDSHYIVLHLAGERRLYGYAEEWPSNPERGHFRIAEPEWLGDGGKRTPAKSEGEETPAESVSAVLIPATEVTMIEFMPISYRNGG